MLPPEGIPSNVILQIDCDITIAQNSDRVLVFLGSDYITLRNLTFRDADSMDTPAAYLVRVTSVVFANPTIEGLVVEGCTFIGTPYFTHGQQFGTDFGVYDVGALQIGVGKKLSFLKSHAGGISLNIEANIAFTPPGDSLVVEDNRFDHLYGGSTGSGNPLGTAIEVLCDHPTVRGNFISQSSGSVGLRVVYPVVGILEDNYVQGSFNNGQIDNRVFRLSGSDGVVDGTEQYYTWLGNISYQNRTHDTVSQHDCIQRICRSIRRDQATMRRHQQYHTLVPAGFLDYDQLGATGLISDHNVIFSVGTNAHLVRAAGGQIFNDLASYQSATGLDVNSHFTDVSFSTDSLGIHLDECEAQNSDLDGIPLPEVPFDFYGARRDTVKPFIGAVEGVRLPYNMFAAPFKAALPGFALSLAQGRFEDVWGNGIAVPDWDNRRVLLFHNEGVSRTFTQIGFCLHGIPPHGCEIF